MTFQVDATQQTADDRIISVVIGMLHKALECLMVEIRLMNQSRQELYIGYTQY